jgi:hypothetical protein
MGDDDGGKKGGGDGKASYIGLMRTLAGLTRRKTEADIEFCEKQIRHCWLERETGTKIPPVRPRLEALTYYGSFIHEMMNATDLLTLLADLRRWGTHPDRCPSFMRAFQQKLLEQKHDFALMNLGSLQHVAAAMGRYGEYDNRPKVTGKLTLSELARYEMGGGQR